MTRILIKDGKATSINGESVNAIDTPDGRAQFNELLRRSSGRDVAKPAQSTELAALNAALRDMAKDEQSRGVEDVLQRHKRLGD